MGVNPYRRRLVAVGVTAALAAASASLVLATSAQAQPLKPCAPEGSSPSHHVLQIGIPGRTVDGVKAAGAVELRTRSGTRTLLASPDPVPGERFGTAVYDAWIQSPDGDTESYLFVGAPGRTVAGQPNAGAVHVFRCTTGELEYIDRFTQQDEAIPGQPQANAEFGSSLTATTSGSNLGYPTFVLVGAPGSNVSDAPNAGAVVHLDITLDQGWTVDDWKVQGRTHTLDSPGVPGVARAGDRLGETLTRFQSQWIAGAANATVDGQRGAGAVLSGWTTDEYPYQLIHQGQRGMPGAPEAGDHFGAAVNGSMAGLWIGVPGEDIGDLEDAGRVQQMYFGGDEFNEWEPGDRYSQDSADDGSGEPVVGTAEAGDRFGAAVNGYTGDGNGAGRVLVGVPGEDIRGVTDAGMVNGLLGAVSLSRDNTPGYVAAHHRFGATVYADGNQATMIGIPGARDGAGAVLFGVEPSQTEWQPWRLPAGDDPMAGDGYSNSFGREDLD